MTHDQIRREYFSARDLAYEKYAAARSDATWARFEIDDAELWAEMKKKMEGSQ